MRKNRNHRLEKLGRQLVELRRKKAHIEKEEEKIERSLIKLMEKRGRKEIILERENRIVRLVKPVLLKVEAVNVFKLLPLKKFLQIVEVKVGELEKAVGREKIEEIAEKGEGKVFLRVELLKKSIRQ